jgi:pilus assembly protein Flp/PilA
MLVFCGFRWSRSGLPSRQDDHGVTAVEYSLMVGLIAAVIVGAVTVLGLNVLGLFNTLPPGL